MKWLLLLLLVSCTVPSIPDAATIGGAIRSDELPSWASSSGKVYLLPDDVGISDKVLLSNGPWSFAWSEAYVFTDSGRWEKLSFDESASRGSVSNGWVSGTSRFSFTITSDKFTPGKTYYVVAYGCDRAGSGFDCNDNKWVLSEFTVEGNLCGNDLIDSGEECEFDVDCSSGSCLRCECVSVSSSGINTTNTSNTINTSISTNTSSTTNTSNTTNTSSSDLLASDFVFYYGSDVSLLKDFGKVVVEASALSDSDLASLPSVCYLSVGEIASGVCPGASFCSSDLNFIIEGGSRKINPVWGSYYTDVSSPSWHSSLVEQALLLKARGCTGLFLDTVDSAEVLTDPIKRFGVVLAVKKLRDAWPSAFIVLNRGFVEVEDSGIKKNAAKFLSGVVDVVLIESFGTTFRFEGNDVVYEKQSVDSIEWLDGHAAWLKDLKSSGGIDDVWILDYRGRDDSVLKEFGSSRASSFGFKWSSSNVYLDEVY